MTSDHWTKPALVAKQRVAKGERIIITNRGKPSPCSSHLKPITSGTRPELAERCSRTGTGQVCLAVGRFGTSLTRGTVTERFALEPVSLVRGVAMTPYPRPTGSSSMGPSGQGTGQARHHRLGQTGGMRRQGRLGGSSPGQRNRNWGRGFLLVEEIDPSFFEIDNFEPTDTEQS